MKIYKYLPPERIDVIRSGRIRYTQPMYLNDPFELKPYFSGLMAEEELEKEMLERWEEFVRRQLDQLPGNAVLTFTLEEALEVPEHHRKEMLRRLLELTSEEAGAFGQRLAEWLDGKIGILSLSRKSDDILMWSHYTAAHRGFVLEFDDEHPHFHGDHQANPLFSKVLEVSYQDERPAMTADNLDQMTLFRTKSRRWEYEEEVRVIRPLEEADERLSVNDQEVCLFEFPSDCLTGVLCGALMPQDVRREVQEMVRLQPQYEHVTVEAMIVDDQVFTIRKGLLGL